ncbi:MAG: (2Fe-2S)-binding protein [Nitriliruptor sp.]|nr:MAG: (2Fe-2S)-binding protein [Nitriliruptor sp.]
MGDLGARPTAAGPDPDPRHLAADLRIPTTSDPTGITRGPRFTFRFDGDTVTAHPGETIAAALLAAGYRELRRTRIADRPRGLFCAIGTCFDCLVSIDGGGPVRACVTPVRPDIEVEVSRGD